MYFPYLQSSLTAKCLELGVGGAVSWQQLQRFSEESRATATPLEEVEAMALCLDLLFSYVIYSSIFLQTRCTSR